MGMLDIHVKDRDNGYFLNCIIFLLFSIFYNFFFYILIIFSYIIFTIDFVVCIFCIYLYKMFLYIYLKKKCIYWKFCIPINTQQNNQ